MNQKMLSRPVTGPSRRLIESAAALFAFHDSGIGRTLVTHLRSMLASDLQISNAAIPLSVRVNALGAQLRLFSSGLNWRTPGFGALPGPYQSRLRVTEIVGPAGMIPHDQIRFGFLSQSAGLTYPSHVHAAEELYLTLSGNGLWTLGDTPAECLGAGRFRHHLPYEPHGIQTFETGLLAMWGWAGDLSPNSYALAVPYSGQSGGRA